MTEATQLRPTAPLRTGLELHYQVAMSQPESHLFEVTLQVRGWDAPMLDLKMPVWTPGSYLVREYARHLQDFEVEGSSLVWRKLSKNHWQIEMSGVAEVTIHYRVFANELTVRTNHLDATHGYFNPAALCFYVPGFECHPIRITVVPPDSSWQVVTPLEAVPLAVAELIADLPNTFEAPDFDTLVDSPFEVGHHQLYEFEVLQKPHALAVWGQGNLDPERVVADTQKIIEVEAALFGGLPYDRYLFLLHLSSQGFGGLEHKTSCTLNYSRFGFRNLDKYHRFMQLVAHEFFHLWNVKRIRPKALEAFDYDGENYTPSLWFSEGTTSYYDLTIPLRAGIYNVPTFFKLLNKEITRFLMTPGRLVQPLSESSFDAWIKLYRRDAYSDNSQMSYYLKGEMVSLLLDLLIRERHGNGRSLDDVMRQLWQQFGKTEIGFTPEELQSVIESIADIDLSDFFHHCLNTIEELPFNQYLEPFGLHLVMDHPDDQPPFVGLMVKSENGRELIKFVEVGSPAQRAGIDIGDELLALNGVRVSADQWGDRLRDYIPGDTIELTFFHQDELKTGSVILAAPRSTSYYVVPVDRPSVAQEQNFVGWLGCSLMALAKEGQSIRASVFAVPTVS